MTAPVPTIPLAFLGMDGHDEGRAVALIRLHGAGILTLTPDEIGAIRQADALARAEADAGRAYTAADASITVVRQRVAAAMGRQARESGTVAPDATAEYEALILTGIPASKLRYEVIKEAAGTAGHALQASLRRTLRAESFRARLVASLDRILDDADAATRIMAQAHEFDYGDPSAVYRADKPIQTAFGALVPIADRHDLLRASVAALWAGGPHQRAELGDPPDELRGLGVVELGREADGQKVWQYQPEGHPIQRLVRAVIERDEREAADAA